MIGIYEDKIRGWWRNLNRPLVSELPKCMLWESFIFRALYFILLSVALFYVYSPSFQTVFDLSPDYSVLISILIVAMALFCLVFDLALLVFPNDVVSRHRLLRRYKEREVQSFTVLSPFRLFCITVSIGLICWLFFPVMNNFYVALQKDKAMLEVMKDGTRSIADDWLQQNQVSMQKYAQLRQSVIDNGWDKTQQTTIYSEHVSLFWIVFMVSITGGLIVRMFLSLYFVRRFYPRVNT